MKRRIFLQGLGAGSALCLGNAWGLSDGKTQTATVRPLVPVIDTHDQSAVFKVIGIGGGGRNASNNPPAKPGAFDREPLKAATGSLTRPRGSWAT